MITEKFSSSKLYQFLDKVKFFGLRKAYYVAKDFLLQFRYKLLLLQDVFFPLLASRFLSRKIIDHYNGDSGHNLDQKRTFLGFGLIHYVLIRNIKPKRVLCVGSRKGFIPAICSLACKDNKMGSVDFVDPGYGENHPKSWSGIGFWKKVSSKKHFAFLNLSSSVPSYISTYVMTSRKFAEKFPKRKYQYIYIDGDHSYEGVTTDYKLFWPRLEKNGFMVFHDVVVKEWGGLKGFGIWKFWRELKNKSKIIFPFPEESGLGILQKQ